MGLKITSTTLLACMLILAPTTAMAEEEDHPFWDQANTRLLLLNVAAQSLDAYSTQRALRHDNTKEFNPLARPFAERGWKGQVAYSYGIGVGGTLALSYLFHRMGQHKRERITPLIVATPTAILGGLNFRF